MGFTKLVKTRGAGIQTNLVSVAKNAKGSQLVVTMTDDIYSELGRPSHLDFFIGDGADAGSALLVPTADKSGYAVTSNHRAPNIYKIGISCARVGIDKTSAIACAPAQFEITEHGLAFVLPKQTPAPRRSFTSIQTAA